MTLRREINGSDVHGDTYLYSPKSESRIFARFRLRTSFPFARTMFDSRREKKFKQDSAELQSKFSSLEFNIFRKMKNIIAPFIALCRPRDYDRVKTEFIKKQEK